MKAAAWPRARAEEARLMVVDPTSGRAAHARVDALPRHLREGDLLVLNDAATIPASLFVETMDGEQLELRLAGRGENGAWRAVAMGAGDWRARTEDRPPPPRLDVGARLRIGGDEADVVGVSSVSERLIDLRLGASAERVWSLIYGVGAPVQYSYLRGALHLWDVQTAYAGLPLAVEMPSAGRPLSWSVLLDARRRGIGLAAVTHAAGLSSTGDAALDALLPLDEELVVPPSTVRAIAATKRSGGRVVAVGTSVVRALEGNAAAHGGELVAARHRTSLRIGPGFVPRVVTGLLSGLHERGSSHLDLVSSFVSDATLSRAYLEAEESGYLVHEFGDVCLVLDGALQESESVGPSRMGARANARSAAAFGREPCDWRAESGVVPRVAAAG